MAEVEWSDEALENLAQIYSDIAADKPGAAAQFVRSLQDAGESLQYLPRRGRPIASGLRELTHLAPYVVRCAYDPATDLVTILLIWHGARRTP